MKKSQIIYLAYLIFSLTVLAVLSFYLHEYYLIGLIWIGLNLIILPLGFIFISNTPKKRSEIEDYPQKLLKHIFEQLDQYVMIISAEGNVLQVTKPWLEVFSITNNPSLKLNDLRNSPKLWSTINQSLATEKGAQFRWEIGVKSFNSSLFPLTLNGHFEGVMVTAIDITKISQLETIQSDFLADISHEIKTPLAAILGASEILNHSTRKLTAKEIKEFQLMIASESSRLQRLINELTDLSKIGTHGFQTLIKTKFSLFDLLEEVKKVHQLQLDEKHLELQFNFPKDLLVFVDRDKFFLIFSNLLSNAIRYTDEGFIKVESEIKNQSLILYFTDTGQGIEPKNLERIFDRFYRTDNARSRVGGGSGLGLAITRAIIQAHQGTIEVKSKLGKGTTFTLTIPHLT
jgi:two-component system, OmpR family, phosphate regulon sensor histidine kinase PhoR